MSISLEPECVVFSVPALSLVDYDSPADMFCVVSSCSVAHDLNNSHRQYVFIWLILFFGDEDAAWYVGLTI